jgi:hypothetical protein
MPSVLEIRFAGEQLVMLQAVRIRCIGKRSRRDRRQEAGVVGEVIGEIDVDQGSKIGSSR